VEAANQVSKISALDVVAFPDAFPSSVSNDDYSVQSVAARFKTASQKVLAEVAAEFATQVGGVDVVKALAPTCQVSFVFVHTVFVHTG
jgi:hypothetical protein